MTCNVSPFRAATRKFRERFRWIKSSMDNNLLAFERSLLSREDSLIISRGCLAFNDTLDKRSDIFIVTLYLANDNRL